MNQTTEAIQHLKSHVDIVDVIGRYINLNGGKYALCPFHNDTKPSFSINQKGQYFHCFACGKGGDVITFLRLYKDLSFTEALIQLAQSASISAKELDLLSAKQGTDEFTRIEILTAASHYYHTKLIPEAREYLQKARGFSEETISKFLIGFANGELHQYLLQECQYTEEACLQAGVVKKRSNSEIVDYFSDHIILPNLKRGSVVHLTGRQLHSHGPKYLHLPGEINHLFNEDDTQSDEVIIAEGSFDCISAVQAGYHAVGLHGTNSFKPNYTSKLRKCKIIYLCLDGDEAGRSASITIAKEFIDRARLVQLPDLVDLNDYFLEHSTEDFKKLLQDSQDSITHQVNRISPKIERMELATVLSPIVEQLTAFDKPFREAHLRKIQQRFELNKDELSAYRSLISEKQKRKKNSSGDTSQGGRGKTHMIAHFPELVDLVIDDRKANFLIKSDQGLSISENFEMDGKIYTPPPITQIPFPLPRGKEVLRYYEQYKADDTAFVDASLFDDLTDYHRSISELPSDGFYMLLAAWDIHTYLFEQFEYSPYLSFFAIAERGKTRTGKGITYVSYRGLHVESLRDAYIIRRASNFRCSFFFDVKDLWKAATRQASEDVLLQRFEKGAKVPRVNAPELGAFEDTTYYEIFGPTIIATNEGIHEILESRSLPITMPETTRKFENDVLPDYALPLKERLVAFRAKHLGEQLPDCLKPAAGRLGDITKPLLQIVKLVRPEREEQFLELISQFYANKMTEKSDSVEADVLMAIYNSRFFVVQGKLPVAEITKAFNEGKREREQKSNRAIGWKLKSLGFQKAKTKTGASAIQLNEVHLKKTMQKYGLTISPETTQETPESPENLSPNSTSTGESGVSGVSSKVA